MKPQRTAYKDAEVAQLQEMLLAVFANISEDNFNGREVTGTTASSANTSAKFPHSLGQVPSMVLILEGNAYVAHGGIGSDTVDIRSTGTSQKFRALVIK
jgi:hypothetical protein